MYFLIKLSRSHRLFSPLSVHANPIYHTNQVYRNQRDNDCTILIDERKYLIDMVFLGLHETGSLFKATRLQGFVWFNDKMKEEDEYRLYWMEEN